MLDSLFQSPFVVLFKKKRIVENQIYLAAVGIFSALCKFEVVTSIYACLTQPPIVIFLFVYMNYKSQKCLEMEKACYAYQSQEMFKPRKCSVIASSH